MDYARRSLEEANHKRPDQDRLGQSLIFCGANLLAAARRAANLGVD